MPRRKFAKVDYELIRLDLPNEMLGVAVRLLWHLNEWYFLDLDDGVPVEREQLERVPVNSRALQAITQRKKRDAQRNHLVDLSKRMGFAVEFDGETAWIYWPNWWKKQGLKPRIRSGLSADSAPKTGEIEQEQEQETESEHDARRATPPPEELSREEKAELTEWVKVHRPDLAALSNSKKVEVWERFRQHAIANAWAREDWLAAFKKWLLEERPPGPNVVSAPPPPPIEELRRGWERDEAAEWRAGAPQPDEDESHTPASQAGCKRRQE